MKFNKIVCVDKSGLEPWAVEKLKEYSDNPIVTFEDYPTDNGVILSRIKDADCVLVSWNTKLEKEVIQECENIKYIGMCCSLYDENSANVDIRVAKAKDIEVRGIRDYGDEGLVEYTMSELIRLLKGLGEYQWKSEPVELTNRKIGIIGMGTTGKMVARAAKAFGMRVYYFSRNRKPDAENEGIEYLPLKELLREAEIISTHLPKNTILFNKEEFDTFGEGKILVNTSLSTPFELPPFFDWLQKPGNYFIVDGVGMGIYQKELENYPKVISTNKVSGWTLEAKERLSVKVLENLEDYLKNS